MRIAMRIAILILITALLIIAIQQAPNPTGCAPFPHPLSNKATWIKCYLASKYELIGTVRLTGYFPQEGEILNCVGLNLVPGDVAVSADLGLRYGDRILICKVGVGWIEGTHIVKDKTASWINNTVDLYVRNPYLASAITGTALIVRVKEEK